MTESLANRIRAGTVAVIAIGAAAVFGGWPFALISFPLLVAAFRSDYDWKSTGLAAVPGLVWLAISVITDDRRCYFPYSLQSALVLATLPAERSLASRGGAFAIVAVLFLIIRSAQDASLRVLTVEALVTVGVGVIMVALHGAAPRSQPERVGLIALASLLAFGGLSF